MSVKVGIMGFGKLGRNMFRIAHDQPDITFAAASGGSATDPDVVNRLADIEGTGTWVPVANIFHTSGSTCMYLTLPLSK